MAQERHIRLTGSSTTYIYHAQSKSAANAGIGSMTRSQCTKAAGYRPAAKPTRSIHNNQRSRTVGRGLHLGQIKFVLQYRLRQ